MSGILNGLIGAFPTPETNSYESIATTTVGAGGASTITFSSIPSTYKHLQIRGSVLLTAANNLRMQVNGDTGSNYSWHQLIGSGGAATASAAINTVFMVYGYYAGTANASEAVVMDILDYADTNKNKTIRTLEGNDINGAGGYVGLWSGNWRSTSAINSISLILPSGLFDINAKVALYGIKG
jgi:hypothetical protein